MLPAPPQHDGVQGCSSASFSGNDEKSADDDSDLEVVEGNDLDGQEAQDQLTWEIVSCPLLTQRGGSPSSRGNITTPATYHSAWTAC